MMPGGHGMAIPPISDGVRPKQNIKDDLKLVSARLRENRQKLREENGSMAPKEFNKLTSDIHRDAVTEGQLLDELHDVMIFENPELLED